MTGTDGMQCHKTPQRCQI